MIPSNCLHCGKADEWEVPDFDPPEPGSDFYEEIVDYEAEVSEHGHFHLCGDCVDQLEADYAGRSNEAAGTLVEVLTHFSRLEAEMYAEKFDPSTREALEVFPNLDPMLLPATRKAMRNRERLEEIMNRVGQPVAIWDPDFPNDEEPFAVYILNESGETCESKCGFCEVVEWGAVNALDYAPDGTLLARPG
jgi:hypothetical protein